MCFAVKPMAVHMNFKIIDVCKYIMINSYFRTIPPRPPAQSYYGTTRIQPEKPITQVKYKKYRLIILILARACQKTLKLTF
jgi:hypothetical protein